MCWQHFYVFSQERTSSSLCESKASDFCNRLLELQIDVNLAVVLWTSFRFAFLYLNVVDSLGQRLLELLKILAIEEQLVFLVREMRVFGRSVVDLLALCQAKIHVANLVLLDVNVVDALSGLDGF